MLKGSASRASRTTKMSSTTSHKRPSHTQQNKKLHTKVAGVSKLHLNKTTKVKSIKHRNMSTLSQLGAHENKDETLFTMNPPNLLTHGPGWKRTAVDGTDDTIRIKHDGEALSDVEYIEGINNQELDTLMEELYVRRPVERRFDNFRRITELCQRPPVNNYNTELHIGVQHALRILAPEAVIKPQQDLCIAAAHRCLNPELLTSTMKAMKDNGYIPSIDDYAIFLDIAVFKRSPEIYKLAMSHIGNDQSKWTKDVYTYKTQYHEIMQEYKQADLTYATGIKNGVLGVPWKPQNKSHLQLRRYTQNIPTDEPQWDTDVVTEKADILHFDGAEPLLSRVMFRYVSYNINNKSILPDTPKMKVPTNLGIQFIVRGINKNENLTANYHGEWANFKRKLVDHMKHYGIEPRKVSRAANCIWIDRMHFDLLPQPDDPFPSKKVPVRKWYSTTERSHMDKIKIIEDKIRIQAELEAAQVDVKQ